MLTHLLYQFGYVAIGCLLVAGGLGFPVPEELVQLTAGYLAEREVLALPWAIATAYAGIATGDFLFFKVAQRHGDKLLEKKHVRRLLTPARRELFERHFSRHAILTIMAARHMSGFRIPAYALAATHGVRARTFLLADAASALLSVPLVVTAGWYFAEQLDSVRHRIHQVELGLAAAVVLGVALWLYRKRRAQRREEAA